ncbi:MAG: antitoxin [Elusimicrobia bacterium]|nr:antitoxin [Elusimicrobiota bacterium]
MTIKLTLAMDDAIVKKAKKYARQRNLSLSKLVEYFFAAVALTTEERNMPLYPITQELAGMITAKNIKEKDILADALIEKYL